MDEIKWCEYEYPGTMIDPPEGCENEPMEDRSYCVKHIWIEEFDFDEDE